MKQLIIFSVSFYLYIAMYFIETPMIMAAPCSQMTMVSRALQDKTLLDIYTTLRIIKQIHRDTENQYELLPEEDQDIQQDFMVDIMIVLVGTYEKIIGTTVTYYLTMNMAIQQDLQSSVAIIIAEDMAKIFNIISKKLVFFIFNQRMTWQQKLWYCTWTLTVIGIIKLGIDQIPKIIKPEQLHQELSSKNDGISKKNNEDKSAYLKDEFDY